MIFIAGAGKRGFRDSVRWSKAEGRLERGDQAHRQRQSQRDGVGEHFCFSSRKPPCVLCSRQALCISCMRVGGSTNAYT